MTADQVKKLHADIPTLMRMARRVYAHTFAKTDDFDNAAQTCGARFYAVPMGHEVIAEDMEARCSTRTSRRRGTSASS